MNEIIETFVLQVEEKYRSQLIDIADFVISLGYKPYVKGVRKDYCEFINSKTKVKIMKFSANPKTSILSMRFFAIKHYDGVLKKALDSWFIYWQSKGYEAKCLKCGRCDGTQGYDYVIPNGETGYLCGFSLIPIFDLGKDDIDVIKTALMKQHEFYETK